MSSAMRLVADAIYENATANASGVFTGPKFQYSTVVNNLREVLTATVARLSWKPKNLSEEYQAKCLATNGCMGLDAKLTDGQQRLVVSTRAIPVSQLSMLHYTSNMYFRWGNPWSIVSVTQPDSVYIYRGGRSDLWLGDVQLPHNVRDLRVNTTKKLGSCRSPRRNHFEQPHLHGNHVTSDVHGWSILPAPERRPFGHCEPDRRINDIVIRRQCAGNACVRLHPEINVIFTIGGCFLLVMTVVFALGWVHLVSKASQHPLDHIVAPQAIARVMLNDTMFPSSLLYRSILNSDETNGANNADQVYIVSLSLRPKSTQDETTTSSMYSSHLKCPDRS